jgi:hypothetical protein
VNKTRSADINALPGEESVMSASVKCPCCAKALYRLVAVSPRMKALSGDSPKMASDLKGYFMKCLHCGKRIAFMKSAGESDGFGFRLAREQPCSED